MPNQIAGVLSGIASAAPGPERINPAMRLSLLYIKKNAIAVNSFQARHHVFFINKIIINKSRLPYPLNILPAQLYQHGTAAAAAPAKEAGKKEEAKKK